MNQHPHGSTQPTGGIQFERPRSLGDLRAVQPVSLAWRVRNLLANRRRSMGQVAAARIGGSLFSLMTARAELAGRVYRPDFSRLAPEQLLKLRAFLADNFDVRLLPALFGGQVLDYGLMSRRLVTDNGVAFIVDALHASATIANLKYHGFGTGTTAEGQTDTALVTELTTEYVSNNTRPTGSQTEGATANIYRTVGTLSPDSGGTLAITEHGIFDQAANSGGTLLDRSKFSPVNLVAGSDSLQVTYDLTLTAGG